VLVASRNYILVTTMREDLKEKRILIVDDEPAILTVLKRSLEKLGAGYAVDTAVDGQSAVEKLKRGPVDLVVTDYRMPGMNGVDLLEAVRALQPGARTILMTAYGNDKVEAETRRLQAYRYLIKPLQIDDFRHVVRTALTDMAVVQPGILILSDERHQKIVLALKRLQLDIGARCVLLADIEGDSIAHAGNLNHFPLEKTTPLLGGCIAGLNQAGQAIDGFEDTISLLYRESAAGNLYIINIGTQLLLMILVDRGPYNSKLGTVWYAAQQVASMLLLNLVQREYANPEGLFGQGLEKAVGNELDRLLDTAEAGTCQQSRSTGIAETNAGSQNPNLRAGDAEQGNLISRVLDRGNRGGAKG
jgi:CheY-like chemotaxis protein